MTDQEILSKAGKNFTYVLALMNQLAQYKPEDAISTSDLRDATDRRANTEVERSPNSGAVNEGILKKLNALEAIGQGGKTKYGLRLPLVLGGVTSTGKTNGRRWSVKPVMEAAQMWYLLMLIAGDTRAPKDFKDPLVERLTLLNRSFSKEKAKLVVNAAAEQARRMDNVLPQSEALFVNMALLAEAIAERRCVTFSLSRYEKSGKLTSPAQGTLEYHAYSVAPRDIRCDRGLFFMTGSFLGPDRTCGETTYTFRIDMICDLAFWDGEKCVEDAKSALRFKVGKSARKLVSTGEMDADIRLYALRSEKAGVAAGLSKPMEKLRNQLFTEFAGRAKIRTDDSGPVAQAARDAGWDTCTAQICGTTQYELENWAPFARGEMCPDARGIWDTSDFGSRTDATSYATWRSQPNDKQRN